VTRLLRMEWQELPHSQIAAPCAEGSSGADVRVTSDSAGPDGRITGRRLRRGSRQNQSGPKPLRVLLPEHLPRDLTFRWSAAIENEAIGVLT
jgi:hypothetical protein